MESYLSTCDTTDDLISFDERPDVKLLNFSEIQKLFDPLLQTDFDVRSPLKSTQQAHKTGPPIPPKPPLKNVLRDESENVLRGNSDFATEDDITNFMELFKTNHTAEKSRQDTSTSLVSPYESKEKVNFSHSCVVSDAQNCVHLRCRHVSSSNVSAFLPKVQSSVELELFANVVEAKMQEIGSMDSNMVYDPVYGCFSPPFMDTTGDGISCDPPWTQKMCSSAVGHLRPRIPSAQCFDVVTPSHLKNIPSWTIPQIEVRITARLRPRQKHINRTEDREVQNGHLVNGDTKTSHMLSVSPRLRLVCDPNTTLVNELLLEALASDALNSGRTLKSEDYQLRLHGRAEILHPAARLCDCNQVQVCYRLDLPLRLVLEPRLVTQGDQLRPSDVHVHFNPQDCFSEHVYRTPTEEEILITYDLFKTKLEKVRTSVSENALVQFSGSEWLKEIQCASSTLAQSVKAVLSVVCQSIAFPDVLASLGQVQISLLEVIRDANPTVQKFALQNSTSKNQATKKTSTGPHSVRDSANTHPHLIKSGISSHCLVKLDRALHGLEHSLLMQLDAFFRWRQIGMRVNPALLEESSRQCRIRRPVGLVMDNEWFPTIDSGQRIQAASNCTSPFTVGIVAVHRVARAQAGSAAVPRRTQSPTAHNDPSDAVSSTRYRSDTNIYVVLSLLYAGRFLGDVYPQDTSKYNSEHSTNRNRTTAGHSRDTFISDPGRSQTIQPGFPKVLQFDQWFTFTGFCINQLPRETLLSISLVSRRYQASDTNGTGSSILLGWVNIPVFDANGLMLRDTVVAGLWPSTDQMNECRTTWSQPNRSSDCPVIQLVFSNYGFDVSFPHIPVPTDNEQTSSDFQDEVISEAKQALTQAKDAVLLQVLNPEAACGAASRCLTLYSEATSASHRMGRHGKSYMKLSSLHLGALSATSPARAGPHSPTRASIYHGDTLNTLDCPSAVAVEVLWNLRISLWNNSCSLVALLCSALVTWPQEAHGVGCSRSSLWSWNQLMQELYKLMNNSIAPSPGLALRLLAADVPDQGIRHWAVRSLTLLPSDVLLIYLPQILEAVNVELHFDYSGLVTLLIYRAAHSMRFANALYWQLNVCLQTGPTIASPGQSTDHCPSDWRFRRLLILKSALLFIADSNLRSIWRRQEEFIALSLKAASSVKQCKTSGTARDEALNRNLHEIMRWMSNESGYSPPATSEDPVEFHISSNVNNRVGFLIDMDDTGPAPVKQLSRTSSLHSVVDETFLHVRSRGLRMPHNPGLLTPHIDTMACTYFHSCTCPLRLVFHAMDNGAEPIMVMFKAGDDLRQDALIAQFAFLMDRLWLDSGLDLRMIHFRILPTGDRSGLIELVSECSTLRQIQQQGGGLTGPFKESVITKWLQSQNTTELDYKRALDNFLHSLAGCCVMTYILGIGDRHNDNIMVRYSGHLFHVDFAKVFGNVQTFAGIKRDRVPFVLTADMLHVLQTYSNEISDQCALGSAASPGSRRSGLSKEGFQSFIDLCCEAYNVLRRSSYALLSVLELGLTMDIPGITRESVRFVMRALKMDLSEPQASQHFTELIHKSLHSRMPAFNFFVHGLAQAKQSSGGAGTSAVNSGAFFNPGLNSSTGPHVLSNINEPSDWSHLPRAVSSASLTSPKSTAANGCPLLSLSPRHFSYEDDGVITAVVVEAATKKRRPEKQAEFYFPMSVWRQDCRVPTRIFRRIGDFMELGAAIQDLFAGTAASHDVHHLLTSATGGSVASVQTQNYLQELVDYLLEEDEKISKSDLVYTFFHSLLFDEKFAAEESVHLANQTGNSRTSDELSGHADVALTVLTPIVNMVVPRQDSQELRPNDQLPGLQLQLCLSEGMNQLNVMIKHGRALYIPGSYELPDVYVKVYLLSGRRKKTTKRKTNIVRRSSDPTFNTTFTYDISMHDIQCGFLEVSAWHAVSLGENIQLGRVYVHVRSLRPGLRTTRWYTLSTDWYMV